MTQPSELDAETGSAAFGRISIDPAIMGGLPCIRGHRMPVTTVVSMVAEGVSVEQILTDFPYLEAEDIAAALRYAAAAARHQLLTQNEPITAPMWTTLTLRESSADQG